MYSPEVSWVGSLWKTCDSDIKVSQTNSWGVGPRGVFNCFAKL